MTFVYLHSHSHVLTQASQASTSLATHSKTRQKQKASQRWQRERDMEFLDCRITLCGISTHRRSQETLRYYLFSLFLVVSFFFCCPEMCNFFSSFPSSSSPSSLPVMPASGLLSFCYWWFLVLSYNPWYALGADSPCRRRTSTNIF